MHVTHRIDRSVFEHLSCADLGFHPVPRLHTLYGPVWQLPHQSEAVALLSGPALRRLSIGFPNPNFIPSRADDEIACQYRPIVRALLADVAASATSLKSLTVNSIPHPSLLEPIGVLRGLLRLDLSTIWHTYDLELLSALEMLDQLEELLLGDRFIARDAMPCKGFKMLRKLIILGGISTVPDLFAALPNLRLKEFQALGVEDGHLGQIRSGKFSTYVGEYVRQS